MPKSKRLANSKVGIQIGFVRNPKPLFFSNHAQPFGYFLSLPRTHPICKQFVHWLEVEEETHPIYGLLCIRDPEAGKQTELGL